MRIDTTKKVRQVAGENIVIMSNGRVADMTSVVALNDTAMALYNALRGRDFGLDDVVSLLTDGYDVDEPTARRDAERWLESMRENKLLTD